MGILWMMLCGKETQGGMGHNPMYLGNVRSKTLTPLKKTLQNFSELLIYNDVQLCSVSQIYLT